MIDVNKLQLEIIRERRRAYRAEMNKAAKNYTPEFLLSLAREFDIPTGKVRSMRKVLRFAAWLYRDLMKDQANEPVPRSLGEELSQIHEVADKLVSAIQELSEPAADLLWLPQRSLSRETLLDPNLDSHLGLTINRYDRGSEGIEIRYLNKYQMVEAIEVVRNYAQQAVATLAPGKSGPRPGEPLRMWVVNVQNFWTKILHRRFSYYGHGDEGITDAWRFCWAAVKHLDPAVTRNALTTAMRKAIKLDRKVVRSSKSRARKIPRKKS